MRRVVILIILAALSVALLGTAAYSLMQAPATATPHSLKRDVALQRDVPSAIHISVRETGIVAVSQSQLHALNLRLPELSAETINLTRDGRPQPFHIIDSGSSATLYFYAEVETGSLTTPVVYKLEPGIGLAMGIRPAPPASAAISPATTGQMNYRWEENSQYWPQTQGDDVWLGPLILAPGSWELPLSPISPEPDTARLTLRLASSTQSPLTPDHHVEILVNGRLVYDYFWDGITQETITLPLLPGTLQPTDNRVTVNMPGDTGAVGEAVYIDWLAVQYAGQLQMADGPLRFASAADTLLVTDKNGRPLIFDVSRPEQPIFINGAANENGVLFAGNGEASDFLVVWPEDAIRPQMKAAIVWPHSLRTPIRGADYVAIVSDIPGFLEATQQLLDYRTKQGLAATAVPLSQVYDEFGFGRVTPDAIRDFLAFAAANWQPTPRFILLVGDDNYASAQTVGSYQWLPSGLYRTQFNGYVAGDTWFTAVDSNPEMPALAIGRFPARNIQQLYAMVNKTIAYETSPAADWQQRALLVTDTAMRFEMVSDALAGQMADHGLAVAELRMTPNDSAHYNIMSAFNRGAGFVNYVGPGGEEDWGNAAIFQADDADMLTNGARLPVFVTFTNLNGAFNLPAVNSLSERLLWAENGGVVAAVAPSAGADAAYQLPLYQMFYDAVFSDAQTLGEALLQAKQEGAENPALRDVIHTINLLGDPALGLTRP
ncbi:MAG: C25 family cysteine peptidase [Anaerolineae bacterium]